jgi:antitoxin component of RelBE/YafQ-DinJ toxin-antitoxin module
MSRMTPRRVTTLRIDEALLAGLEQVWESEGILVSEQVRRAIQAWLRTKGIDVALESPRQGRRPWDAAETRAMRAWDDFEVELRARLSNKKQLAALEIPAEVYAPLAGKKLRDVRKGEMDQLIEHGQRLNRQGAHLHTAWLRTRDLPKRY